MLNYWYSHVRNEREPSISIEVHDETRKVTVAYNIYGCSVESIRPL